MNEYASYSWRRGAAWTRLNSRHRNLEAGERGEGRFRGSGRGGGVVVLEERRGG